MRKIKLNGTSTLVQVVIVPLSDGVKLIPRYFEYESPALFDLIREVAMRAGMSLEDVRVAARAETWRQAMEL